MVITMFLCKYCYNLLYLKIFLIKGSKSSMPKEKVINIRVDAELKRQAKKLAENDGRSLSNWILRLIQDQIDKSKNVGAKKAS